MYQFEFLFLNAPMDDFDKKEHFLQSIVFFLNRFFSLEMIEKIQQDTMC